MEKNYESERHKITLDNIWRGLTALGHHRLWLKNVINENENTWIVMTWDSLAAAVFVPESQSWHITNDANFINTNPNGLVPEGLCELTWLSVQRITPHFFS